MDSQDAASVFVKGDAAAPPVDPAVPADGEGSASLHDGFTLPPEPGLQERLAAVKTAKNPLLEAAQPLLRALADMPSSLDGSAVMVLRRLLEREVTTFQRLCNDAAVRHEHVVAASYALCTALDEAINLRGEQVDFTGSRFQNMQLRHASIN